MRMVSMLNGVLRIAMIALFSGGHIKICLPSRAGRMVGMSWRKGGRITLGKRVSVNCNAELAVTENAALSVGSYTGIGNNCVIVAREKITIGNNVMIGPNVCIYDHDHNFREDGIMREMGFNTAPICIEDNVWLGAGVIVLKGVTIGEGSVVAAGTLVTKDVPPNSVLYDKRESVIKKRI